MPQGAQRSNGLPLSAPQLKQMALLIKVVIAIQSPLRVTLGQEPAKEPRWLRMDYSAPTPCTGDAPVGTLRCGLVVLTAG